MNYLIIVDVQKDFVDGALGTKEAQAMLPALLQKAETFSGEIIVTLDTHFENYMETAEGKSLPVPHCIKGTEGWRLTPALEEMARGKNWKTYEKPTFGSAAMMEDFKTLHAAGRVDSVELVGLCTDICVVSNALLLKAAMPEVPICVDARCCAGVSPETHEAALAVMQCCQIQIRR